jgi:transposase-like protein
MKQAILSKEFEAEAIARLKSGESLTGKGGILTPLIKQIIEASLEGELESHLLSESKTAEPNRRNGKTSKVLKTGTESFELETPRDRLGTFEPQMVKKRQTVLNESLDNKILSLYALGMSYEAIQDHLAEM